jgi:predicted cupin superfamily sugar epimerase
MKTLDANDLIERLELEPHPEGGYFRETYRSREGVAAGSLPERFSGRRDHSTAIYYLLTEGDISVLHRIRSDEVFHFYMGSPVRLFMLSPDGESESTVLGTELYDGHRPQAVVPFGHWQGLSLVPGGSFSLLGATVAPGFDFADFEIGSREALVGEFPGFEEEIVRVTRG